MTQELVDPEVKEALIRLVKDHIERRCGRCGRVKSIYAFPVIDGYHASVCDHCLGVVGMLILPGMGL